MEIFPMGKSFAPQLIDDLAPHEGWSIDELGRYAETMNERIADDERRQTAVYWRLGDALAKVRKKLRRGEVAAFLAEWRVSKTRASKALAIRRTFSSIARLGRLSVEEAYAQRRRRNNSIDAARRKKRKRLTHEDVHGTLRDFLTTIAAKSEDFLGEAETSDTVVAVELFRLSEWAREELDRLVDALRERLTSSAPLII